MGDGSPDFTKTYEEYHLSIAGHPFTLIDVPGIEGNESEFKDVIKTALHKAHCVFYVQGHNKSQTESQLKNQEIFRRLGKGILYLQCTWYCQQL